MERSTVEQRVKQALRILFHKDDYLFIAGVSEWTIAHKLAEYLQEEFLSYHVDREYNRVHDNYAIKRLSDLPECYSGNEEWTDEKERRILPDIIVHERGIDSRNLLVIEMKLNQDGDRSCDLAKLRELTKESSEIVYQNGLFIDLPTGDDFRQHPIDSLWFENGMGEDWLGHI